MRVWTVPLAKLSIRYNPGLGHWLLTLIPEIYLPTKFNKNWSVWLGVARLLDWASSGILLDGIYPETRLAIDTLCHDGYQCWLRKEPSNHIPHTHTGVTGLQARLINMGWGNSPRSNLNRNGLNKGSIHDSAQCYFAATKTYKPESTTLPAARCSCYTKDKPPSVSHILQMTSTCERDRSSWMEVEWHF